LFNLGFTTANPKYFYINRRVNKSRKLLDKKKSYADNTFINSKLLLAKKELYYYMYYYYRLQQVKIL
jgi:hypothetical protein